MNRKSFLVATFLASISVLCCRTTVQNYTPAKAAAPQDVSMDQKLTVAELKQRYLVAGTEQDRRDVCLIAIDQGLIKRTGLISVVDELFGTRFADRLPSRKEEFRTGTVDFLPSKPSSDNSVAAGHKGWFLAITYDFNGEIQNYYLTNLHK